ncbi:MAG: hypothetical protein VB934_16075 [Polyangiaceae bacterium]
MLLPTRWLRSLVLIGFASSLVGCTENGVSLFIQGVPRPDPEGACVVDPDPGGTFYLDGKLDKLFRPAGDYTRSVLIGNQMQPRGDADTLRPETSQVQFYEAEVTVFDVEGNQLLSYTHPTSGFVYQATGIDPSYGTAQVTMIPPEVSSVFDTSGGQGHRVVSRVRVFGTTIGGTEVSTGNWDWPIFLCETSIDPNFDCIGGYNPEDAEAECPLMCKPGQDEPIDIRYFPGGCCRDDTPACESDG